MCSVAIPAANTSLRLSLCLKAHVSVMLVFTGLFFSLAEMLSSGSQDEGTDEGRALPPAWTLGYPSIFHLPIPRRFDPYFASVCTYLSALCCLFSLYFTLCHLSVVKGIFSDSKDLLRRDPLLFVVMQTCIVLRLAYPAGAADVFSQCFHQAT